MGFTFLITFHMEVCNIRLSLLHVTSVFICITFISCGYFFETKMVELNIHKHLLDNIRSKKEFKFYRTDLLEPSWNFTLTLDSGNTNLPLTWKFLILVSNMWHVTLRLDHETMTVLWVFVMFVGGSVYHWCLADKQQSILSADCLQRYADIQQLLLCKMICCYLVQLCTLQRPPHLHLW